MKKIAKVMRERRKLENTTKPDFKIYYKIIVTKIASYQQNQQVGGRERPEIKLSSDVDS